jgi:arylsulfatase A-like enzyme
MRTPWLIAFLAPANLALAQELRPVTLPAPPPDIVVVVYDDVSWYETQEVPSPHLDRLAAAGVRFDRAYANPVCWVSRLSIMFGTNDGGTPGETCGFHDPADYPVPGTPSLPRVLPGYRSTFLGKWHLGSDETGNWPIAPLQHGFQRTFAVNPTNLTDPLCGGPPPGFMFGLSYDMWWRSDDGSPPYRSREYHTLAVLNGALAALAEPGPEPALVFVSLYAAHSPFDEPPGELLPPGYVTGSSSIARYRALYRTADEALGRILDAIDLSRTLVIVTGDNGTPPVALPPEWPDERGKRTTYERGVRVPLVVGGAGVRNRGVSDALVHVQDLMPTLASLSGRRHLPQAFEGVSFARVLTGSSLAGARTHVIAGMESPEGSDWAAIETRWKLRRVELPDGTFQEELFDLAADPLELVNLVDEPDLQRTRRHLRYLLGKR